MTRTSVYGQLLRLARFLPMGWRLPFLSLAYPEPEMRHLGRIEPRRGVAIDAGANIGLYSHALRRHYRRVIAFEPNRVVSRPLEAWSRGRVELHQAALSSTSGEFAFFIPDGAAGWASLHREHMPPGANVKEIRVPAMTLDSLELEDVCLLKIDVEGHEYEVLKGADATLKRCRPTVIMETRDQRAAELLGRLGYSGTDLRELIGIRGAKEIAIFTHGRRGEGSSLTA